MQMLVFTAHEDHGVSGARSAQVWFPYQKLAPKQAKRRTARPDRLACAEKHW